MELNILPTDTLFSDSPNAGEAKCLCSRCSQKIEAWQVAIRAWPENGNTEYRFHTFCIGLGPDRTKEEYEAYRQAYEHHSEGYQESEDMVFAKCPNCRTECAVYFDTGLCPECELEEAEALANAADDGEKCRECGCNLNMACFDLEHGPCWWITHARTDEGPICSHCYHKYPDTFRPWQDEPDANPNPNNEAADPA